MDEINYLDLIQTICESRGDNSNLIISPFVTLNKNTFNCIDMMRSFMDEKYFNQLKTQDLKLFNDLINCLEDAIKMLRQEYEITLESTGGKA